MLYMRSVADVLNNELKLSRSGTKCNVFISQEKPNTSKPVDFFVERLRHEHQQAFADWVLSNITRLIDLPGKDLPMLLTGE